MVDVGGKAVTTRQATASGVISMSEQAYALVVEGRLPKGDIDSVARLAGIQAAKNTSDLIPLCHPLALDHVDVAVRPESDRHAVRVTATVRCSGRTGVEMEALAAAAVALLSIYDMVKGVDRTMVISEIRLDEKTGGSRGDFVRTAGANEDGS